MHVLTVCTANQCRSVLTERAIRQVSAEIGAATVASSAGVRAIAAAPMTDDTARTIKKLGWPVATHSARHIDALRGQPFDLVLTAERAHLVPTMESIGIARHRIYTVREIARLVAAVPPTKNPSPESLDAYLLRISKGRELNSFLGIGTGPEDLADPTGQGRRAHRSTALDVERLVRTILRALPGT